MELGGDTTMRVPDDKVSSCCWYARHNAMRAQAVRTQDPRMTHASMLVVQEMKRAQVC